MSENNHSLTSRETTENAAIRPRVDVLEDKSGITLYADLAGVPKDKLSLSIEADTLTIEGDLGLDRGLREDRLRGRRNVLRDGPRSFDACKERRS